MVDTTGTISYQSMIRLKQNHNKYNIEYGNNIQSHGNVKKARGYRGLDTTYRNNLS